MTPPLPLSGVGASAVITPDGSYAVVAGWMSTIFAFHLGDLIEPDELNLDALVALGEVLSGHQIHAGGLNRLTTEEWLDRWRRVRQQLASRQTSE